ncbi:MAG: AHH domain-containing protein [Planctomyces sp.]
MLERFGIDVIYDKSTLKNMSPKDLHNLAMAMNNYRGMHSDAYAEAVWRRLQDVIDLSNSKGWSKKRIKEALQDALSRMRRDLEEGKVFWPET